MRVISVISDSNIGGAGNVLVNFMKFADRERFEHTVVLPEGAKLTERLRALGVRTAELPGIGEKSFDPRHVARFLRLFRETRPALVHTHASLSARVAARLYGRCAVVHTRHSAFTLPDAAARFPRRQLSGFVNNAFSDRIIAVSPACFENLVDLGANPRRIVTLQNGVAPQRKLTAEERAEARARFGIREGEFACAIIARLEEVKGHRFVLDAARLLRDMPARILIAGAGALERELRCAAADEPNVTFLGFVSDVCALENAMDVQLNASFGTEASSLSLLEGMSLGKPAIVSDFGGNPSVIRDGENGFVVPRRSGAAIAEKIRELYGDRELYGTMSRNAERIYNAGFTGEIMARNIENVYRLALRARGIEERTNEKV
jgi:glycosyltransferase involved in cell wall biosynthesis